MHRRFFRAGEATLITEFRTQFSAAVLGLIIDETDLLLIRADAVRPFLAQPFVERVLMPVVVRRLLELTGWDLAFLSVAGDLLLGKRADQIRLALGIEVFVFGELAASLPPGRTGRGVQVGNP